MSNQDPRGKGLVEHLVPKEVGFQYDKECQHCKEINNCGFASAAYDQIQRLESQVVIGSDGTQVEFREEIILSADKVSEPGPEVSFKLSPSDKLVGLEKKSPVSARLAVRNFMENFKWNPPEQGRYKINYKVVSGYGDGRLGISIVIRDDSGFIMASCALCFAAGIDIWVANALAILKSFHFANDCGLFPFVIESDTKRVVNWISNFSHLNSHYGFILQDIDNLRLLWNNPSIVWSSVGGNKVAFSLSMVALRLGEDNFWI
ncbi:hypothetical protein LWI29_022735 [Acer saccharum]|uniref:RNase H type-1 domain-containing protein n=1 Tax=Acer saccharum TaxID=4024 RepID=A0AA39RZF9_ACESA|nr:hypothetical protein LWI29_022735 [Acer saccharum]